MKQKLGWLTVGLGGLALAGGRDAPTFLDVFRQTPGARQVIKVPDEQLGTLGYTHRLIFQNVGAVFLTRGALEGSDTPNTITAWVSTSHASIQQQRAMVAVIRHTVARCHAPLTAQQLNMLHALAERDWRLKLGWQEQQIGPLKVGWGGREGLNIGGHDVGGMSVDWPNSQGVCRW
ncbi:hypothetical protein [Deinococcus puniceus]|uniref:hypothetical protein n=1 Tax=Deinococcus puniceus TaxID=1182568 RepID=UPI000B160234|nr:hypothetical protein [Deinococcus puniceus]